VKRRELILLLAGAMTTSPALHAQQKAVPVIGWLSSVSPGPYAHLLAAFRQGLTETGYVEGQNVAIEYRWAEGRDDRLPEFAADLVDRNVDLIVASGSPIAVLAAKSATSTIPIVFPAISDPVAVGLVASLAHPGGNLTGFSPFQYEMMPKRLELLTELVPQARVIALLVTPNEPRTEGLIRDMQEAAHTKGVQLQLLKASTGSEIDAAFATLVQLPAVALVLGPDSFLNSRREQIVALASRHAFPTISAWRELTAAGGLISYGPNIAALCREAGIYAGRILKGEKPADLPVQRPTRFELVINLKTARALGLTVPPRMLDLADEVIE
jgi:putative ABC transport system substrate-binding protein